MRVGSGRRASGVGSRLLTMSPRKDGSSTPSTTSTGELRGLANWPAMRPILTTGRPAP